MGRLVVMTPSEGGLQSDRAPRDSVFLQAAVSAADGTGSQMFKIRNISRNGMMAEGPIGFDAGCELIVELRNIGSVRGRVTWARDNRFGFRFDHPVDPKAVRIPLDGKAG